MRRDRKDHNTSNALKLFISYSRRDAATADAIVSALEARGFQVTIDRRDLPFGEEWQKELAEFIRQSDTIVWLVSEASITSEWVNWELDEVKARNKRLVPVMVGLVTRPNCRDSWVRSIFCRPTACLISPAISMCSQQCWRPTAAG